ncbi:cation:proton antiporter [Fusibacter paucivorans]|nr:cation:proton antiporter [Fusibacter paucivorans]
MMQGNAGNLDATILALPALILFLGVMAAKISKWLQVPDIVVYLLAGVIIGPAVLNIANLETTSAANQFILTFGSAFILYDGGREIKLKVLNKVKITVALLATAGVFLSAAIIGAVSTVVFHIEPIYGLLIGAVIASTDPAALVPIFQKISIVDRVKQTVISESAFNDAAGAILVLSIIAIIQSGQFSLMLNLESLVQMILFGVLSGAIVGLLFSFSVSEGKYGLFTEFAPVVSILAVLISYSLAEVLGGSGYMSAFVTGLICGNKKQFKLWVPTVDFEIQKHVRETVTTIMKISIFILLGIHVDFGALQIYWKEALIIVAVLIFIARPLTVFICTKLDRRMGWQKNEILFMMWVRETGVIPAALTGVIVSEKIPHASIVSAVVFMTILLTLMFQATTTKIVATKLGLIEKSSKQSKSTTLDPLNN